MASALVNASTTSSSYQYKGISNLINRLRYKLSSFKNMIPMEKKKNMKPTHDPLSICTQQAPSVDIHSTSSKSSKIFDRVFDYFDENGDGKISSSELLGCMNVTGEMLSLEEAEVLVRTADSDGDGLLGFDDFVALVEAKEEEERGRSLKEAFEVYEMEGEGCITARSLRKALRRRLGEWRSMEECKAMICKFDLNGDGVISFEEFKSMML